MSQKGLDEQEESIDGALKATSVSKRVFYLIRSGYLFHTMLVDISSRY